MEGVVVVIRSMVKRPEVWLVFIAICLSVSAYVFFYQQGTTLGYKDNYSHLEIGRRIVAGKATGFGQLGGIWLPLQHVLIMLTAWNDYMYLTGLSGAVISMVSYVISTWCVFRIIWHLTGRHSAAWTAAAVFGLSANMLYLQSTSMGEVLMYLCITVTVLCLVRWIQTDHYGYLVSGAVASLALTFTRYEGWVMALTFVGVVFYTCLRHRYALVRGSQKGQAMLLIFGFFPALGIFGWLLWNQLIFGDWLNWLTGQYGSKDQVSTQTLTQVGNPRIAATTYWYAMVHTVTIPLIALAVVGLVVMLVREKFSPASVTVMSTLVMAPFFIWGLYAGNQPMHVVEVDGDLYNLRFGVVMMIPVSLLIGYLVGQLPAWRRLSSIAAVVVVCGLLGVTVPAFANDGSGIVTNREAHQAQLGMQEQAAVGAFIQDNTVGNVLMESFNNERILFPIQKRVIYEGSQDLWTSSLIDPTGKRNKIDIIVMRSTAGDTDLVYEKMYEKPVMYRYKLVLQTDNYLVYRKKGRSFYDQDSQ
ncbi:hypothetical protein BH09PAT4_BH09PAT4_00380 [soil metagenome]